MSTEAPEMVSPFSEGDLQAAKEMISESEYLKDDEYAREVVEAGGKLPNGGYVKDLGNWLATRQVYVMSEVSRAQYEGRIHDDADLMSVSSVRPDIERYL